MLQLNSGSLEDVEAIGQRARSLSFVQISGNASQMQEVYAFRQGMTLMRETLESQLSQGVFTLAKMELPASLQPLAQEVLQSLTETAKAQLPQLEQLTESGLSQGVQKLTNHLTTSSLATFEFLQKNVSPVTHLRTDQHQPCNTNLLLDSLRTDATPQERSRSLRYEAHLYSQSNQENIGFMKTLHHLTQLEHPNQIFSPIYSQNLATFYTTFLKENAKYEANLIYPLRQECQAVFTNPQATVQDKLAVINKSFAEIRTMLNNNSYHEEDSYKETTQKFKNTHYHPRKDRSANFTFFFISPQKFSLKLK